MKGLLILLVGILVRPAFPAEAPVCASFNYQKSSAQDREELLSIVKEQLLSRTEVSHEQLTSMINLVVSCQDQGCLDWINRTLEMTRDQYRAAKLAQALSQSSYFFQRGRQPRNVADVLNRFERGQLEPRQVGNFNISGFEYSESDKQAALNLWIKIFAIQANNRAHRNVREVLVATKTFFAHVNQQLLQSNVVLAFLNDQKQINRRNFARILEEIRDFNDDFGRTVSGYKVHHTQRIWSNLAIFMKDHEMGLVNFEGVALSVIGEMIDSPDYAIACSAWQDLKRQQRVRVNASIGVGFSTAVLCGVGIWSGIGTIPASILCAPAIADGIVGGSRGVLNAQLSEQGFYAGRDFTDGLVSEGIFDYATSEQLQRSADIVALVNFVGLIPIYKSLRLVSLRQAQRGKYIELVKLPSTDSAVSFMESQSNALALAILLAKGVEFIDSDWQSLVAQARSRAI